MLRTGQLLHPASNPASRPEPGVSLPGTLASPRTGLPPAGYRELGARLRHDHFLPVMAPGLLDARGSGLNDYEDVEVTDDLCSSAPRASECELKTNILVGQLLGEHLDVVGHDLTGASDFLGSPTVCHMRVKAVGGASSCCSGMSLGVVGGVGWTYLSALPGGGHASGRHRCCLPVSGWTADPEKNLEPGRAQVPG